MLYAGYKLMEHLKIPKNYASALSLHDTQVGIKTVKDFFQNLLAERLNLLRVSAPLFVDPASGMNDNLNGVERPVSFGILEQNEYTAEIVQSLAKWKRYALKKYGFCTGAVSYTHLHEKKQAVIHSGPSFMQSGCEQRSLPALFYDSCAHYAGHFYHQRGFSLWRRKFHAFGHVSSICPFSV